MNTFSDGKDDKMDDRKPSPKMLHLAESLAQERDLTLTDAQRNSQQACSAFIDEWMSIRPAAWKKLKDDIENFRAYLPGIASEDEAREAGTSLLRARELHARFLDRHADRLLAAMLDGIGNPPPGLADDVRKIPEAEARYRHLEARKKDLAAGKTGFARIDPTGLKTVHEKFLAYWIEGLQSTAFEALGKLDNCLGRRRDFDSLAALLKALENTPIDGLRLDDANPPVRNIVLKIKNDAKRGSVVIATLPISPLVHERKDGESGPGYRWVLARDGAPSFNREQLGSAPRTPGLMLERVAEFDAFVQAHLVATTGVNKAVLDLDEAIALWDRAFDTLVADWPIEGVGGLEDWIACFRKLASQPYSIKDESGERRDNPLYFWQIAKWEPVFTLVDASAVGGVSAAVCNAYRHYLAFHENLSPSHRALFERIASLAPGEQQPYLVDRVACDSRGILCYYGNMDSRDDENAARRKAYPLDPAQRDALLALAGTPAGSLLAVNGPPGTGKTSLLRGVIASQWIGPLLNGAKSPECPMIVACAATNQAVTNIISSFDETPGPPLFGEDGQRLPGSRASLESRWLPALASYGWYAPASVGQPDDNKRKKNDIDKYQIIHRGKPSEPWQFHGIAKGLGEIGIRDLKTAYVDCASQYLGKNHGVAAAVRLLHRRIVKRAACFAQVEAALRAWVAVVPAFWLDNSWGPDDEAHWVARSADLSVQEERLKRLEREIAGLNGKLARLSRIRASLGRLSDAVEIEQGMRVPNLFCPLTHFDNCRMRVQGLARLFDVAAELLESPRRGLLKRLLHWDDHCKKRNALGQELQEYGIAFDADGDLEQCRLDIGRRIEQEMAILEQLASEVITIELRHLLGEDTRLTDAELDYRILALRVSVQALQVEQSNAGLILDRTREAYKAHDLAHVTWRRTQAAAYTAHKDLRAAMAALDVAEAEVDAAIGADLDQALRVMDAGELDAIACGKAVVKRVQDLLDTRVRTALFHLAARYWEGRYVLARLEDEQRCRDDIAYQPSSAGQLRLLAMLAPVFVVTAFSVPKLMRCRLSRLDAAESPYLFGEADLLIVDEAGQCTPEIGAVPFLFARRAIVVGDVEQLEPVWGVDNGADRVHVAHYRLDIEAAASEGPAFARLAQSGNLMSNGSVMRMAQRASAWHDPRFQATGLTLTNHYRCLKPIIEICNDLVYRGNLIPSRREPAERDLYRPDLRRLGYLVVDEVVDTRNPGGSRRNRQEAELVAAWIRENESSLLKHYDRDGGKGLRLRDVVAVVTPFTGQVREMRAAIARAFGDARFDPRDGTRPYYGMTIDTVHSLQGAEKPVVVFSMVETSKPNESQFYDRGSNLINVAVSRARDLFVVALSQAAVEYAWRLKQPGPHDKASDHLWRAVVRTGSRLNARRLVLVESPSKCDPIKKALGGSLEWEVLATQGNITSLADARAWSITDASAPRWQELTLAAEQTMRQVVRRWPGLESLYLATDPDAEGEQIAWQLLRILKERVSTDTRASTPKVLRMRFHSLDEKEIARACREAGEGLDAGMVKSALARALLDRLISTEYPKRIGVAAGEAGFAAGIGRVQLGLLDLVARAEARRCAYHIEVEIPLADGERLNAVVLPKGEAVPDDGEPFCVADSEEKARHYAKCCQERLAGAQVKTITIRREIRQLGGYPAINTANLLALAWRAKDIDPAKAMQGLQELYESGAAARHEEDEEV
ncbi:MAG: hypothetical protein LBP58_05710 [Azoarcus sp.]|jgi:hypothetical protein|nr:hypothetical protein [Azoarcus sp.]